MKQKDKTQEKWNTFIKPKYQCYDCGFECRLKYTYNLHLMKCSKSNTFHKKAEAVRRFL